MQCGSARGDQFYMLLVLFVADARNWVVTWVFGV